MIKNIVYTFFQLPVKRLYCLCYCFGNIFDKSKKVSEYVRFNSTTFFYQIESKGLITLIYIFFKIIVLIYVLLYQSHESSLKIWFSTMQRPHIELLKCQNIISIVLLIWKNKSVYDNIWFNSKLFFALIEFLFYNYFSSLLSLFIFYSVNHTNSSNTLNWLQ